MIFRSIKTAAAYILVLLLATSAFGQQPQGQTQTKSSESPFVDFTGFKGKIIEVKNRDANELARLLRSLGSGFKGATIEGNTEFKTIVVRDFPENIAAIEEAVKRLDVL